MIMGKNNQHALLCFVGDIMLGDSFNMFGIGVGSKLSEKGASYIFNKVIPYLEKSDINIGNLECAFSNEVLNPLKNFKTHIAYSSEHVKCLRDAGFNILNMANNHTMQYGSSVFLYTETLLIQNEIKTIGTINNPYQCIEINKIKFSFLGYSLRPNQFEYQNIQYINGDRRKILDDIKFLREENDHVVVSLHWGDEYIDYPEEKQIVLAHELIDAGASLIIGHHPHVLQGIEHYRNGVIAYSLGNFVFDKPQKLQKTSMILNATISKERLEDVSLEPIYINSCYQPEIVSGKQKKNIEGLIERLSKKILQSNSFNREYDKDVSRGLKLMRLQFCIFFFLNLYRFPPASLLILIKDALLRRFCKRKI